MSESIFTKIVKGEIPAYKIAEDQNHLAFLDVFPLKKGHVLVIPKRQEDKLFDLSSEEYNALMQFTYPIAKAIENSIPCKRIGMAVLGMEVPHAHVHLVPLDKESDLLFSNPKLKFSTEEFQHIAESIKQKLS